MRKLILLAALFVPAAAPSAPANLEPLRPVGRDCPKAGIHQVETVRGGVGPRRLDQLPPGRLELTVLREVDRCPIPAVLREGIGANSGSPSGRSPR